MANRAVADHDDWLLGGASVIGAAHERRGVPNQDAIRWVPAGGPAKRVIIALSDGHGGAAHFRSDIGAKLATDAAVTVLDWFFDADDFAEAADALPGELVACWREMVAAHAAEQPFGADDMLLPYGATCVAAAIAEDRMVLCQLGDGDLLVGLPDGRITRPFPTEQLPGEQTYSLCLPNAEDHARVMLFRRDAREGWPDFVMLSTDGVAKSFPDAETFEGVVRRYRELGRTDLKATLDGLPEWLADVTRRGSGDDVSLCLAVRGAGRQQETRDA